jgi:hypothetical protein
MKGEKAMISERTLKQWRKHALHSNEQIILNYTTEEVDRIQRHYRELQERILRLTQELMDLHLIQKGR